MDRLQTGYRLRRYLGWLNSESLARSGDLPGPGRPAGSVGRRARLSLPAGGRIGRQPTDLATPRVRGGDHHDAVRLDAARVVAIRVAERDHSPSACRPSASAAARRLL